MQVHGDARILPIRRVLHTPAGWEVTLESEKIIVVLALWKAYIRANRGCVFVSNFSFEIACANQSGNGMHPQRTFN